MTDDDILAIDLALESQAQPSDDVLNRLERCAVAELRRVHSCSTQGRGQRHHGYRGPPHAVHQQCSHGAEGISHRSRGQASTYFCSTSSVLMVILISSPTTTPPVSSAAFHSSPNALRSNFPFAEKPRRVPPQGSLPAPSNVTSSVIGV